jgi:hypothetical protein
MPPQFLADEDCEATPARRPKPLLGRSRQASVVDRAEGHDLAIALTLYQQKQTPEDTICQMLKISRATFYRYVDAMPPAGDEEVRV